MSHCSKSGAKCDYSADCIMADDKTGDLCPNYTCYKGKCASMSCATSSDCSAKFGSKAKCINGVCNNTACDLDNDCPFGMTCKNGRCDVINCDTVGCPSGMKCKQISDGSKICLSNPGINTTFWIVLAILGLVSGIIIGIIIYVMETHDIHNPFYDATVGKVVDFFTNLF